MFWNKSVHQVYGEKYFALTTIYNMVLNTKWVSATAEFLLSLAFIICVIWNAVSAWYIVHFYDSKHSKYNYSVLNFRETNL